MKIFNMRQDEERKNPFGAFLLGLVALLIAGGSTYLIYQTINTTADAISYTDMIVAATDIPENTIITADNVDTLFTVEARDARDKIGNAVVDTTSIIGYKTKVTIDRGQVVALTQFGETSAYIENLENPIEVSLSVKEIGDVVAGRIRAGDIVNLTVSLPNQSTMNSFVEQLEKEQKKINEEAAAKDAETYAIMHPDEVQTVTKETEDAETEAATEDDEKLQRTMQENNINPDQVVTGGLTEASDYGKLVYYEKYNTYVMENIYVTRVYDANGNEIASSDTGSAAQIFVFTIPAEKEQEFYNMISLGGAKISKIL